MSVFNERPWDMRGTPQQDTFDFGESQRQAVRRRPTTTGRRAAAPMDTGTVGIAISGMAFYWLMPALMSSRTKRRRRPGSSGRTPRSQSNG